MADEISRSNVGSRRYSRASQCSGPRITDDSSPSPGDKMTFQVYDVPPWYITLVYAFQVSVLVNNMSYFKCNDSHTSWHGLFFYQICLFYWVCLRLLDCLINRYWTSDLVLFWITYIHVVYIQPKNIYNLKLCTIQKLLMSIKCQNILSNAEITAHL